jgi:glycosyltransferase involved in cell wall biosynthesis
VYEAPIFVREPPAPRPAPPPVEELPPIDAPKLAESSPYPDDPPPPPRAEGRSAAVVLDGVVFTAVLSPKDGRKNWIDLLTAFIAAFRDTQDATLVLKMVAADPTLWWWTFHDIACRMAPFSCRIVVLQGYLDDARYSDLISATDWALNASLGEGMCLPLVEFMSGGRPAVAPCHTAMLDYIDETNAVLIRSEEEYCAWPHDPRDQLKTTRQRVEWTSIRGALLEAYRISTSDRARYRSMSEAAAARIRDYCSDRVVADKLAGFLGLAA